MARQIIVRHSRPAFAAGIIIGGLVFGGIAWFAEPYIFPSSGYRGVLVRQSSDTYEYIEPLLACDVGTQELFPELAPTKAKIQTIIANAVRSGQAKHVSVYFRTMKTGRWFDIDGARTYTPASLFKVFVMMAYYKEADDTDNPGLLQKSIVFTGSSTSSVDVAGGAIPRFAVGRSYTVADYIKQMIVYSDNQAAFTLVDHFDAGTWKAFNTLFSDLQIPSPEHQVGNINPMSVDQYAMVFRVLFGSTYLSRQYSDRALELLSQATYKSALVAGVPSDLVVSHKYGSAGDPVQLHDCGIVYYPEHPYLLCVMTEGSNFSDLQRVIKDISAAGYERFSTLYPAK